MRIIVTANQAPFFYGGGEAHVEGLCTALRAAGHEIALLRLPFKFAPESEITRLMTFCDGYDLEQLNGQSVDRVISLQFPGWGMRHSQHIAWIMHQHRAVYELYHPSSVTPELQQLRAAVHAFDRRAFTAVTHRFANSRRVAQRLHQFMNLEARPLYHPPPFSEHLYCAEAWDYVFCPSRLESLKRQDLLIEAARYLRTPVCLLIGGEGGQRERYQCLIDRYDLNHRVRLLGRFSVAEGLAFYAHALGVAFVPFDEDLGYVALEAMYAAKPVLTCEDSGGPLEFVRHGETGMICPAEPRALAAIIDDWWQHRTQARDMGYAGRSLILHMDLSWTHVIETLCSAS